MTSDELNMNDDRVSYMYASDQLGINCLISDRATVSHDVLLYKVQFDSYVYDVLALRKVAVCSF